MEMYSIWAILLSAFVPLFIIGAIIYLVVQRRNGTGGITAHSALITYFYFAMGASLITTVVGVAILIFIGIDQAYGGGTIASSLSTGLTLLGTGAIVYFAHMYGRRAYERQAERPASGLKRVYLFLMLAIFSISGLVTLPLAISETISYYAEGSRYWDAPSAALATAITIVPLWIYYLLQVLRETLAAKKTSE